MSPPRLARGLRREDGTWGCPHCTEPIHPPMQACECIRDADPPYWRIQYQCSQCQGRYVVAVQVDLSTIDPERTARMPLRTEPHSPHESDHTVPLTTDP